MDLSCRYHSANNQLVSRPLPIPLNQSTVLKTAPAIEPVTADEFKSYARIDTTEEGALLSLFLTAAREASELYTGRAFINQTWIDTVDVWPSTGILKLGRSPLVSITEVREFDNVGSSAVFDSANYFLNSNTVPGTIFTEGAIPTPTRRYAGIEVEYVAGYGAIAADVPSQLKLAIIQWAADMYETRVLEGTPPEAVAKILDPHKIIWL